MMKSSGFVEFDGYRMTVEKLRKKGKLSYFYGSNDKVRLEGLRMLIAAEHNGDAEAAYIIGVLILRKAVAVKSDNPTEYALGLIQYSANEGFANARSYLDTYCELKYTANKSKEYTSNRSYSGPLVDFDGKIIKIERKGVRTPIDALLKYEDGENVLTFGANLVFPYEKELRDKYAFQNAVTDGIAQWEGEYEVFGGQKLRVKMDITVNLERFSSVSVIPLTDSLVKKLKLVNSRIGDKDKMSLTDEVLDSKRSFALMGEKWSVHSKKRMYICTKDGSFKDYEEIKNITKHEFGHLLGLGDLYANSKEKLAGVSGGSYGELDDYIINNKIYNLVMCDYHGPISNNDIEMIVLAFRDNKAQLYQPDQTDSAVSKALGKGN